MIDLPKQIHAPAKVAIRKDCDKVLTYLADGPKQVSDILFCCELNEKLWRTRKKYLLQGGLIRRADEVCPCCGQVVTGIRYELVRA